MGEETLLAGLSQRIIDCNHCPRLREWCAEAARTKKAQYRDQEYWGRPVPGFGDPNARLLILGLAPGAHGANRTGRVFTGDESGKWLYEALHRFGFASQPAGTHKDDGLVLTDCYINNIVRCAPPQNKPTTGEIAACQPHLVEELELLQHVKVVLALGQLAFKNYLNLLKAEGKPVKSLTFSHGAVYDFGPESPKLVVSYHPSHQNTFTGVLTRDAWYDVFKTVCDMLHEGGRHRLHL